MELTREILQEIPLDRLAHLSREELLALIQKGQKLVQELQNEKIQIQREKVQLEKENEFLEALAAELAERLMVVTDQYIHVKNKIFRKSSERSPKMGGSGKPPRDPKDRKSKIQLPSQRYPEAAIIEREVTLETLPECKCCGEKMVDSGMIEESEYLTTIPRQYLVVRQKRHKYRCGKCHGDIQTAPAPSRIKEGSGYSDEMMIDVALTKYCDLVPIERYTAMAGREGLKELPQQSLIESTHYLADFVKAAYDRLKSEILQLKVLHADETPHRMLEGDKTSQWYLWGFSGTQTSYFEHHNTRSGDVASELLKKSDCLYLSSDVFSGYGKAVRITNEVRKQQGKEPISHVYCNAHARRRFREAKDNFPEEAEFFIDRYKEIYHLESEAKGRPPDIKLEIRKKMAPLFEEMKARAELAEMSYSSKSRIVRATHYFIENYAEFTRFIENADLPIDNNPAERLLRNAVVGRKTWYGTHSKRGAETASILFSLVESAKLNDINPRKYFRALVQDLHDGKTAFTPKEFKEMTSKTG